MKKNIRKRAKRVKNGTTMWKLTVMNTHTGKTTSTKVRGTYDEITVKIHRLRSKSKYNSICAEEMNKWGAKVLENGRVLALDSVSDEQMFDESETTCRPTEDDPWESNSMGE